MNELIELWNSYPMLVELKVWIMTMSLTNLGFLGFILLSYFTISLTVTVNGNESSRPKVPFTLVTLILLFDDYPSEVWLVAIPFGFVWFCLLLWNKPMFTYLNFFMPNGSKLSNY